MNSKTSTLGPRFDRALVYAHCAHGMQTRKGNEIPYISHLLGVASIALELGADEDQAVAALLHDAVEDQGGSARLADIKKVFGSNVAAIVADCTDGELDGDRSDPENWHPRKEAYIAALKSKPPQSLLVSLADKTHNARAILDDLIAIGTTVFDRFTGRQSGTLWYYATLADTFCELLPGHGSRRLASIVDQMHRLASADAPQLCEIQ